MCPLIGLGRWSRFYYYILISTLVKFFKEDILGVSVDHQLLVHLSIIHHPVILLLIGFLSDFIICFIAWFIMTYKEYKNQKNDEDIIIEPLPDKEEDIHRDNNSKDEKSINTDQLEDKEEGHNIKHGPYGSMKFYLIHNDTGDLKMDVVSKNSLKFIILSSFLIAFKESATKILFSQNDIFDYYFLNLVIIFLILKFYFKQKVYKHQIFSIIFVSVIAGVCLIVCTIISENNDSQSDTNSFTYNFRGAYYVIIIFIVAYIIICISFCFGIIIQKNLIHLEFQSPYKLLFNKGLFGIIISAIAIAITSSIKCNEAHKMEDSDSGGGRPPPPRPGYVFQPGPPGPPPGGDNFTGEHSPRIFVCADIYDNYTYFDNILSYYEDLRDSEDRGKEIAILVSYFILHFVSELSLIFVNKFLTPIHYLITESIYSLLHLIYQLITNYANQGERQEYITQNGPTRILRLVAVFIEILGYLIFLEIIQLNFCGINRDVSQNIEKRANVELTNVFNDNDSETDSIDFNSVDDSQSKINKKETISSFN